MEIYVVSSTPEQSLMQTIFKAKHLKDSMCSQFSDVFTLCQFVMDNSNNAALVSTDYIYYYTVQCKDVEEPGVCFFY